MGDHLSERTGERDLPTCDQRERRHKHDKLFKLNLRNSGFEVTLLLKVKEFTNAKHIFGRP